MEVISIEVEQVILAASTENIGDTLEEIELNEPVQNGEAYIDKYSRRRYNYWLALYFTYYNAIYYGFAYG